MSFQRIINPYHVYVPEAAKAAGFEDKRFPNKAKAQAYVKEVQKVCPDFNPLLRIFFRYEDTATGKLYSNKWEYLKDQEQARQFREQQDAKQRERNRQWQIEESKRTGPLVPTEAYLKERGY